MDNRGFSYLELCMSINKRDKMFTFRFANVDNKIIVIKELVNVIFYGPERHTLFFWEIISEFFIVKSKLSIAKLCKNVFTNFSPNFQNSSTTTVDACIARAPLDGASK